MADSVGKDAFLRQQKAIMGRLDSRPDLSRVDCPTLVLCSREDVLTPLDLSEEISDFIPGADLILIGDCGHLSTMERPDAVNAALASWLAAKALFCGVGGYLCKNNVQFRRHYVELGILARIEHARRGAIDEGRFAGIRVFGDVVADWRFNPRRNTGLQHANGEIRAVNHDHHIAGDGFSDAFGTHRGACPRYESHFVGLDGSDQAFDQRAICLRGLDDLCARLGGRNICMADGGDADDKSGKKSQTRQPLTEF